METAGTEEMANTHNWWSLILQCMNGTWHEYIELMVFFLFCFAWNCARRTFCYDFLLKWNNFCWICLQIAICIAWDCFDARQMWTKLMIRQKAFSFGFLFSFSSIWFICAFFSPQSALKYLYHFSITRLKIVFLQMQCDWLGAWVCLCR